MLKIFNELSLFFEDVYRDISVREYARIMKISPPTASKLLKEYEKEDLLISEKKGVYVYYVANRENVLFKDLNVFYWKQKLMKIFLEVHKDFLYKKMVLFGSVSKAENTLDSDLDIYVDLPSKNINLENLEKVLKRKIQLFFRDSLKNKNLQENIKRGVNLF